MSGKRTTARAFHEAAGGEDWRVLFSGAHAFFTVGSFAEGARFVAAIAEVAEAVGHFPDVDMRPEPAPRHTKARSRSGSGLEMSAGTAYRNRGEPPVESD